MSTQNNCGTIVIENDPIEILEQAHQGPPGPPGPPGPAGGLWVQVDVDDILPAATAVIGSIPVVSGLAVKWIVVVRDDINDIRKSFEILAQRSGTSGPSHTQYGNIGDSVPFTVDVVESGGILELRLTNNGAVNLDTRVLQGEMTL